MDFFVRYLKKKKDMHKRITNDTLIWYVMYFFSPDIIFHKKKEEYVQKDINRGPRNRRLS